MQVYKPPPSAGGPPCAHSPCCVPDRGALRSVSSLVHACALCWALGCLKGRDTDRAVAGSAWHRVGAKHVVGRAVDVVPS